MMLCVCSLSQRESHSTLSCQPWTSHLVSCLDLDLPHIGCEASRHLQTGSSKGTKGSDTVLGPTGLRVMCMKERSGPSTHQQCRYQANG